MFIFAFSVCKSLQCLISTLIQGSKDVHLFMLTCSVAFWGGSDNANKYHWHVWGLLTMGGPHWVCHNPRQHVFPRSTLLRLQGALQGLCPRWALHFVKFLGLSHSGSQVLHRGTDPDGPCFLCPSQVQSISGNWVLGKRTAPGALCVFLTSSVSASQFPWCDTIAQSQVCCVSPLGSLSQTETHPWQMSTIQGSRKT